MSRLREGGLIDRNRPVSFSFDGRRMAGFAGDTLASALLANDVRLVGRSFKYHRPRGILTAGSEEPNGLVEIGRGAARDPNMRATGQEIYDGLDAWSQNRMGGLGFDFLAVNDWLAPFLSAGFYYKTFMWPKAFWEKLYEPAIRRAAGLGALSGVDDPDVHDKAWAHCDLLVVGAGPAGLMAALTAGRAGRDVILADEDFVLGGRLVRDHLEIGGGSAADWANAALGELAAMDNVRVMPRTTVTGAFDGGTYGAWQRVGMHLGDPPQGMAKSTFWRIVAKRAVLAGGAHERLIAFPNNDRPGVMQAGAVRSYLNRFGVAPGRRVVVFTNNDDGLRTAQDCVRLGVNLGAVVDVRSNAALDFNCPTYPGGQVVDTRGRRGLAGVKVRSADGETRWIEADCLAVSGGWNPSVHLTCHMGGRPVWDEGIAAFKAVDDMVPGLLVAGSAAGDLSTHGALQGGMQAACRALDVAAIDVPEAEDAPVAITPFWHVDAPGRAWLDFQNDVTTKDVKQAHQENFRSVEHMKRYTTLGMATDQGKTSNMGALAIMAEMTGASIPQTGTTTFRPPYVPVPIAAMGARASGKGFAPERLIPSHDLSVEMGAHMMEAGLWYRPGWFPREGEGHWRMSCDREVNMVRQAVGVCDVSTLGKIDVQGPDSAAFLDFVYSNMMSTLKVGKVRYGLMLREDGFVMDDGTCARFDEDHFVITTTTAAAGQVMAHLEFVHQCLRPEMDVAMISVTDSWAQFAVAGPRSRELINDIIDAPVDNDSMPYMGHGPVSIGGIAGRLFRISFSGEHAYEISVPTRYGEALMRALVATAEAMGGGAYGMEALNVLRIEKGFITHAEIHGRVTAADIGMGRMVSAKKDCIGKAMAGRSHLISDERQQLVGLKPVGAVQKLLGGSHVVDPGMDPVADNDLGYVTSVCYGTTVGHMIGLAFVENGRARMGEQVRAVDLLRDFDTLCEIVDPVFHDKDGEALRG